MPKNLAAMVVTRSTYGRLGLISATAALVRPGFKGCLVVEVVNLGTTPVALCPGLAMTRLVFFHADPTRATALKIRLIYWTGVSPRISPEEQQKLLRIREAMEYLEVTYAQYWIALGLGYQGCEDKGDLGFWDAGL